MFQVDGKYVDANNTPYFQKLCTYIKTEIPSATDEEIIEAVRASSDENLIGRPLRIYNLVHNTHYKKFNSNEYEFDAYVNSSFGVVHES